MNLLATPARLSCAEATFEAQFKARLHWSADTDAAIEQRVADILADVQQRGDAAVLEYTARFDGLNAASMAELELTQAELKAAFESIPAAQRDALQAAARRVRTLPRGAEKGQRRKLELPRRGRHAAGPEGHAAGPRRHLRARRQGGLSVVGADERDSRACGRCRRDHHGRAHAQGREKRLGAGRRLRGRRHARLHHRRRAGRGRAGLRHGDGAQGGQDHRPRQRLRRQRQEARVRHGRHRHDCRAVRNPGAGRRHDARRLGGDGPVQPGRA